LIAVTIMSRFHYNENRTTSMFKHCVNQNRPIHKQRQIYSR